MEQYGKELQSNLRDLIGRAKSGRYHAPPVRRVPIPKGDGNETRPIGIPTTEDKVLQRAITMLLEPIYEQEFKEFSFGFRPGRSAHDGLEYLWKQCMDNQVRWIVDVDIRSYFDTLDHGSPCSSACLRRLFSPRCNVLSAKPWLLQKSTCRSLLASNSVTRRLISWPLRRFRTLTSSLSVMPRVDQNRTGVTRWVRLTDTLLLLFARRSLTGFLKRVLHRFANGRKGSVHRIVG